MLGATNGLAQTVVSVRRSVGPAIAASLLAFSLENSTTGGCGVVYALTLCTFVAIWPASQLPRDTWKPPEDPSVVLYTLRRGDSPETRQRRLVSGADEEAVSSPHFPLWATCEMNSQPNSDSLFLVGAPVSFFFFSD